MKLYYDTLIPYMPDAIKDENGATVSNPVLAAGRRTMMELAEFQATGNLMALYQAVIYACKYANKDLIEAILGVPDDLDVIPGTTVDELLNEAVIILFKSINSTKYPFDLDHFLVNVLTAEHIIFVEIQRNNIKEAQESDNVGDDND